MKIAIYFCVSTEDQAKEVLSFEVQKEYPESFVKRVIVKVTLCI